MIHLISENLTKFIYNNIQIENDMRDVYKYGIEVTISSTLNIILIILASTIILDITFGIIFLIVFVLLRSFSGGYHANTYFKCNLVFVITFLSVYGVNEIIINFLDLQNIFALLGTVGLLSLIIVVVFSPVKNKHKLITANQAKKCRIKAVIVYFFLSVIALIVICSDNIEYGAFIIITLTAVAVMILIEIIKRRYKHES